jgi:hypothetical protein
MPKHDWAPPEYANPAEAYQAPEERICGLCGARQQLERDYWWGRIVGRRWRPLVGRCPGAPTEGSGPRPRGARGRPRR